MQRTDDITELLARWREGDDGALATLTPLIHHELHQLAAAYMAGERPGHVLQTTALINEAYLRLIDWKRARWQNRAQFYGVAAQIMRHVLVDIVRAQRRAKRGGRDALRVSMSDVAELPIARPRDLLALDDALKALAELDERHSRVVELRFFGGLSYEETAQVLNVSVSTVRRDWSLARAWLYRELSAQSG